MKVFVWRALISAALPLCLIFDVCSRFVREIGSAFQYARHDVRENLADFSWSWNHPWQRSSGDDA